MFRRKRLFIRLVFAALLLAALVGGGGAAWRWLHPAALPPLEVSLWYWHQPFRLPPREIAALKALGVRRLFVHAGTFRRTDHGIRLVLPQQWASRADGLEIHLVFNFDYNIVRDYGAMDNETLADAVEETVPRERVRAEAAGLLVAGIQLDFDCPTRRLTKYAALLHRLHAAFGGGRGNPAPTAPSLSITALPTWFGSDDVRRVMDEVDFTVPQYYEAQIPRRLDAFATVSRLAMVARGLRAAGRTGSPA